MRLSLFTVLVIAAFVLKAQTTSIEYFNLEDSIRKRIYDKIGPNKVICPRNGAGFPTRNCSYAFSSLKIMGGRLQLDPEVSRVPIPQRRQNIQVSYPNCSSTDQQFQHRQNVRKYEGHVLTTSQRFITTSSNVKGSVNIDNYSFEMSLNSSTSDVATINTSETVSEAIEEYTFPLSVPARKIVNASFDFTQSIAYQNFEGRVILDGTVQQSYIMAISDKGKGKWVSYTDPCALSSILTEEERTFDVTGRFGNINAVDYSIQITDERCPK